MAFRRNNEAGRCGASCHLGAHIQLSSARPAPHCPPCPLTSGPILLQPAPAAPCARTCSPAKSTSPPRPRNAGGLRNAATAVLSLGRTCRRNQRSWGVSGSAAALLWEEGEGGEAVIGRKRGRQEQRS